MSWPYRCKECFRSGDPQPPFSSFCWSGPGATREQRARGLSLHMTDTIAEHAAATGHNDWDGLNSSTPGSYEHLGAYMGDGWFQVHWDSRPWWERQTSEELTQARAWERDPTPLPQGEYCVVCGWRRPSEDQERKNCEHIGETGHNDWGWVHAEGRELVGPIIGCGDGCQFPEGGRGVEMWARVHGPEPEVEEG